MQLSIYDAIATAIVDILRYRLASLDAWWEQVDSNHRQNCLCEVLTSSRVLRRLVGTSGLEPPTSRLSGVCSNQLSYVPVVNNFFSLCLSKTIQSTLLKKHFKLKLSTFGGGKRDRTADPLLARQVLSQLSYTPKKPGLT